MHLDKLLLPQVTCERLKMLLTAKTSAHLYIFVAPLSQGASSTAKAFLLDWLGTTQEVHPDLFELFCSGKAGLHSVNKIRELLEDIALTPHASKGRAVLIHSAERMLSSSSNALLKVLEEPPPRTLIVLATDALQKILPTIASRAQIIRLPAASCEAQLDLQPVLDMPSYKSIHEFTASFVTTLEEERDVLEKDLLASHSKEDLPAVARQSQEQDIEAELTLFMQQRAQKLLGEAYLALRATLHQDPQSLTLSLLQALKAIERGSDLKRILPIFLSDALLM
jgi:hypothetical protein